MKLKRIKKITDPVRCSFCKVEKTLYRIQGYPHFGKTACKNCFQAEKKVLEEYQKQWGDREQSEAEFQLGI